MPSLIPPTKAEIAAAAAAGLPAPGYKKDSEIERQKRVLRDEEMVLLAKRGVTPRSIARKLGISDTLVSRRLPQLLDRETQRTQKLIQREIVLQLGMTQTLMEEVWEEWNKSKGLLGKTVRRRRGKSEGKGGGFADGADVTETITREVGVGDPRLAGELRQLMDRRLKLVGMDIPEARQQVINNILVQQNTVQQVPANKDFSAGELSEVMATMNALGISLSGQGYLPEISAKAEDYAGDEPIGLHTEEPADMTDENDERATDGDDDTTT